MTRFLRQQWKSLGRRLGLAVAGMLVLLAMGNVLGMLALQVLERHPDRIAAWLGARAGRPVAFDRVATRWTARGPLLRLDGLRIGDPAAPVRIGAAEVLVAQYTGLLPGRSFTEIRIRGLDLTLLRAADGRWQVRGLPGQRDDADPLSALEHLGELQLARARLRVLAPELGVDLRVPRVDVRMQVDGDLLRAGAHAWLRDGGEPVAVAARFNRDAGDGRLYAGSRQADLRALAGAFAVAGVTPAAGRGRLQAWATLRARRVVGIRADADLDGVVLRGAPMEKAGAPTLAWKRLRLQADWSGTVADWRLRVPVLRLDDDQNRNLDGMTLAGGRRVALRARTLQAAPLLELLALSDAPSPRLRAWLQRAAPDARFDALEFHRDSDGVLQARARVSDFRFAPVGHSPGMRGVGGWLQGDQDGLRIRFDPTSDVSFDWPAGFGVSHAFRMDGEAVLWREGDGWTVRSPGMAIDGDGLQVRARGGITFQNDGSHPHLDIAADIGDVPIAMAHGFWIHHLMPKATVQWLDAALRGGTLRNVHAIVAGDLDDWPFRNEPGMAGAGVFRADARIDSGTVKFRPDWPAAERLDADVSFVADGFTLRGSARLGGVPVTELAAGIEHFHHAELTVDATAAADAAQFLAMLRTSPLQKDYGAVMGELSAEGPVRTAFALRLPLHRDARGGPEVAGRVELDGARLLENRWKLDFTQVHGSAQFDHDGFEAAGLQVRHGDAPGLLSLRAGAHVQDPAQVFEGQLQARMNAAVLLGQVEAMGWLRPYLRGSSTWNADLAVARGGGGARLRVRSDLVGTAIDLPAPLAKPAGQRMATDIAIRLPATGGDTEVDAALGDVLALRARGADGRLGLRIALGEKIVGEVPANGLVIRGHARKLDALGWAGFVSSGGAGARVPVLGVDLAASRLVLLGAEFADAGVRAEQTAAGMQVRVQANGISGGFQVPRAQGAAVSGQFERVVWPQMEWASGAEQGAAPAASGVPVAGPRVAPGIDPTSIPPLAVSVRDLRVGKLSLGQATFRSTPIAGGIRVDEFSTGASKQRIKASGRWTGRGADQRSELKLTVDSSDMGALLMAFGLGGQVAGGKGTLKGEARWRGGPGAFDPRTMEASLALDARDGRLLEVEPGAGRFLGLLGVAQLPRRLMLDFSDFVAKGFSFDRIQGTAALAGGILRTDDLAIKGPAASIEVRGSADLRNRRFDQVIEVKPHAGGLLTAVGAIAGGPVGAAVGAVANAVFDKPIGEAGAKTYHVSGAWDEPVVEVIERDDAKSPEPVPAKPSADQAASSGQ